MIPDFNPIEWAALGFGGGLLAFLAAYCLGAPALERFNVRRFERETEALTADVVRRPSLGERVTRAAYWCAAKVMRLDRTGGDRS